MMQNWANFARTGNPNSVKPFKNWETFDSEKRNFMRFDLGDKTRPEDNFRQKWAAAWLDMMVEIYYFSELVKIVSSLSRCRDRPKL